MGLIKTAIMTGGGLYAVNKIVKTIDRRGRSNRYIGQIYPRDSPSPAQGYYRPSSPPFQGPSQHRSARDETYGVSYQKEGQRDYDSRGNYSPKQDAYPEAGNRMMGARSRGPGSAAVDNSDDRNIRNADYPRQPPYVRPIDNPPSYSPRAQDPCTQQPRTDPQKQIQGYEREQQQGPQSPGSLRDLAAGAAVDFMRKGKASKSGKRERGSKGGELLSGLFG